MTTTNHELPSLITANATDGLKLAAKLASELQHPLEPGNSPAERPGGTNYLLPAPVPQEIVASVLFYAIAAANRGWTTTPSRSSIPI